MNTYIIGITGASGSIYAKYLINYLAKQHLVKVVFSNAGEQVYKYELDEEIIKNKNVEILNNNDLFSKFASGTVKINGMVVVPCSMSSLAKIACGITETLMIRVADVCLKERRTLILVPRETPISSIHLDNMSRLIQAGAILLPASPGFYNKPKSIEDLVWHLVGKIVDQLGLSTDEFRKWQNV